MHQPTDALTSRCFERPPFALSLSKGRSSLVTIQVQTGTEPPPCTNPRMP